MLAPWAIMRASSPHHYLLNRRFAREAGFTFASIGAVLELKEAFITIGVHIVGN
jgi:hypothetical protein